MRGAWLGVAWILGSCRVEPEPGELLFTGCGLLDPDGRCWANEGVITVWGQAGAITLNGAPSNGQPVDGGARHTLRIDAPATVAVDGRVALRVVPTLDGVGACPATSGAAAGWCLRQQAREALGSGGPDAAAALYEQASDAFGAAGWPGEASLQRDRAAWVRAQVHAEAPVGTDAAPVVAPTSGEATRWLMAARRQELSLRQLGLADLARQVQRAIVRVEARVGIAKPSPCRPVRPPHLRGRPLRRDPRAHGAPAGRGRRRPGSAAHGRSGRAGLR